ncbi:MAG: DUF2142 domain-containing protein [Myxococcota bacterium]
MHQPLRSPGWERAVVALLCLLAAVRVAAYAAVFPLFNNVDEYAHFDLVAKYARGHDPARGSDGYDAASARIFVLYGSPEYGRAPDPATASAPLFTKPPDVVQRALERHTKHLGGPNHEAHAPPVYYAVAGAWYRLGRALGLGEAAAVFWIRVLNAGVVAALVALAWLYARRLHPDRPELRLGVPLLVAFLPQDVFYGINSDVFSPLFVTAAALALFHWRTPGMPSPALGVATGLSAALAFLVKLTNAGMLAIVAAAAAFRARRVPRSGALLAVAAALLPVAAWMLRNLWLVGDLTGNGPKLALLGWGVRPVAEYLDHPIFQPARAWDFLTHLAAVYWRGEYVWHGVALRSTGFDAFYGLSTALLLPLGVLAGVLGSARERAGAALNAACVGLGVACLVALSVWFAFGEYTWPSRSVPFFAAGRLIIGTLVPFACLYVGGLAFLTRPLARRSPRLATAATLLALVALVGVVTTHEARLHAPVRASAWGWHAIP